MELESILGYLENKTILITGATGFVGKDYRKKLFKVLKEKLGADFDSFILEKVVALSGDVVFEDLGVKPAELKEEMCNQVQIILNSAATTGFDERYDVALGVNTFGVLNMLDFAKKCLKLEMLVHVSTAYVCGERAGLILEDSSSMEEMEKKTSQFDLKLQEKKLVEGKLKELKAKNASEEVITTAMKDLGTARAKLYGWPNTYTSTYKEPFQRARKG